MHVHDDGRPSSLKATTSLTRPALSPSSRKPYEASQSSLKILLR